MITQCVADCCTAWVHLSVKLISDDAGRPLDLSGSCVADMPLNEYVRAKVNRKLGAALMNTSPRRTLVISMRRTGQCHWATPAAMFQVRWRLCFFDLFHCNVPSVSSSLQITNRSFTYASPYLWNQLPSSFRQPHSVHSPPGSPHPAHITSSQSPPSLSSPITTSTFHSRLKTHLFHKSFPP